MLPEQDQLLEELYRTHFHKLMLYATSVLNDEIRSQDVVQDVFHDACRHIDTLSTHTNPGGWLMCTLKNKLREVQRASRRYSMVFTTMDPTAMEGLSTSDRDVEDGVLSSGALALEEIKSLLSKEDFQLLEQIILDKTGYLRTAKFLDITVYAARKRMERLREKLYKYFEPLRLLKPFVHGEGGSTCLDDLDVPSKKAAYIEKEKQVFNHKSSQSL